LLEGTKRLVQNRER